MKSAFELAMERFGGEAQKVYTDDQKAQLKEIDSIYDSKAVQARFDAKRRIGEDPANVDQINQDMRVELASIEEMRERKKNALRKEFDAQ